MTVTEPTAEPTTEVEDQDQATDEVVTDDVLVEEISIDGMCGVY